MRPSRPLIVLQWTEPSSGTPRRFTGLLPLKLGRSAESDVVLHSSRVSPIHASLALTPEGEIELQDWSSAGGTRVNGALIHRTVLRDGDTIAIGPFVITVGRQPTPRPTTVQANTRLRIRRRRLRPAHPFPPPAFADCQVSLSELRRSGLPLSETTYLALGGGMGSFVWVDHLVICGANPADVVVIGVEREPYGRYRHLCRRSQIPDHERLRSDSGATPDNIWGWPGYAVRESWRDLRQGRLRQAARCLWQIFGEPTLATNYTPRAGDVYAAVAREAERIGWGQMWRYGRIRALRQTDDGRYVVAYSQSSPQVGMRHCLIVARYVHIAVGYPGVRFLPDLQAYRAETLDFRHVVNAYEDHEHVYDHLAQSGGTVLLRGRGIVASRILQRLDEVRRQQPRVRVVHLMRSPITAGARHGRARREVAHHWEFQPYNWPKAAFGGEYRDRVRRTTAAEREQLLNDLGGTTTASRPAWRRIVAEGVADGWYQIRFGSVVAVSPSASGRVCTLIRPYGNGDEPGRLITDFVLDCTGLNAGIENHPLLRDLLRHYRLPRNVKGNLDVNDDFEVAALRNGNGRVFASGVMTFGGPLAPVDSFLGLQLAAQCAVDCLCRRRAPGLRYLNGRRSLRQWWRWVRGAAP